jgi:hypothetical protein
VLHGTAAEDLSFMYGGANGKIWWGFFDSDSGPQGGGLADLRPQLRDIWLSAGKVERFCCFQSSGNGDHR